MTKRLVGVNALAWPFWHVTQRSRLLLAARAAVHQAKWCCALGKGVCDNPRLVCLCVCAKGGNASVHEAFAAVTRISIFGGAGLAHILGFLLVRIEWYLTAGAKDSAGIKQPNCLSDLKLAETLDGWTDGWMEGWILSVFTNKAH